MARRQKSANGRRTKSRLPPVAEVVSTADDERTNEAPQDEQPEWENLYHVLRKVPLIRGDLYLNMQAMNIGITDASLQDMEQQLLHLYLERERTPTMEALTVSAWSQMWVFALYELLRTWRQRAKELAEYGRMLSGATLEQRMQFIAENKKKLDKAAALTIDGAEFRRQQYELIENEPAALGHLERGRDLLAPLFRLIEDLRVTLAKHEIPKSTYFASAPGYGRIDMSDGSIYWFITRKDNTEEIVSRRRIADTLRELSLVLDGLSAA